MSCPRKRSLQPHATRRVFNIVTISRIQSNSSDKSQTTEKNVTQTCKIKTNTRKLLFDLTQSKTTCRTMPFALCFVCWLLNKQGRFSRGNDLPIISVFCSDDTCLLVVLTVSESQLFWQSRSLTCSDSTLVRVVHVVLLSELFWKYHNLSSSNSTS